MKLHIMLLYYIIKISNEGSFDLFTYFWQFYQKIKLMDEVNEVLEKKFKNFLINIALK